MTRRKRSLNSRRVSSTCQPRRSVSPSNGSHTRLASASAGSGLSRKRCLKVWAAGRASSAVRLVMVSPTLATARRNACSTVMAGARTLAARPGVPRSAARIGSGTNKLETLINSPCAPVWATSTESNTGMPSTCCSQAVVRKPCDVWSRIFFASVSTSAPCRNNARCSWRNDLSAESDSLAKRCAAARETAPPSPPGPVREPPRA